MDPITLATVTSAVTMLATEASKGAVSEAGKDAWHKIKSWLGWHSAEPPVTDLAPSVAKRLQDDPALAERIAKLLQSSRAGTASTLVGSIKADKVIVANQINNVQM